MSQPTDVDAGSGAELVPTQGSRFHLGNRPALDGMRAVAVLLVMLVHLPVIDTKWTYGPFPGGFLGVDLFFVLSGFLISSLLIEEYIKKGRVSFRNFYERRGFRLLPALFVVLAVQLAYVAVEHHSLGYSFLFDLKRVASVFFYFFNWTEVITPHTAIPIGLGVMWTLAIEAQFYLVWPIVLRVMLRTGNPKIVFGGMAALALLGMVFRAVIFHHLGPLGWAYMYPQTEARLDDFMCGATAAYALHLGWRPGRYINVLGVISIIGFVAAALTVHQSAAWLYYGGYTLFSLGAVIVVLALIEKGSLLYPIFASRIAVNLGQRSYSLYLWHTLIFAAIAAHWVNGHHIITIPLAFIVSYLVAAASYKFVERPFLDRKKKHQVVPDHRPEQTAAD